MGEWTEVASANRGVLGSLANEEDVEEEPADDVEPAERVRAGVRLRAIGRFFSSWIAMLARLWLETARERKKRPVFGVDKGQSYGVWRWHGTVCKAWSRKEFKGRVR